MVRPSKKRLKRYQQNKFVLCYKVLKNDIVDEVVINHFKSVYEKTPSCESVDIFKSNLDSEAIHFDRFNDQNEYCYFYINFKWRNNLNIYYSTDSSNNKCLAQPKYLTLVLKTTFVSPILFPYSLTGFLSNVQVFSFQDYIKSRNISNKVYSLITLPNNFIEKESFKTSLNFKNTYVFNQNEPLICFKVLEQIQSEVIKINLILCFVIGSLSLIKLSIHTYFQIKTFFAFVKLKNFNSHCRLINYRCLLSQNKFFLLQKITVSNPIQFPTEIKNLITAPLIAITAPAKIHKTMLEIAKLNPNFEFISVNESVKTDSLIIHKPKVAHRLPLTANKISNLKSKSKKLNVFYLISDKTSLKMMHTLAALCKSKPTLGNSTNCLKTKSELAPRSDLKTSFKSESGASSEKSEISKCLTNPRKKFNFNIEPESNPVFDFGENFKQYSNSMCKQSSSTKTKPNATCVNCSKVDEFSTPKKKLNFDNVNLNASPEDQTFITKSQTPVIQTQIQSSPQQDRNQNKVSHKNYYVNQRLPLADINQNKMPPKHFN